MTHLLAEYPVHLACGGAAEAQPAFSGMAWYAAYEARSKRDGACGRLVSMHTFSESWTSWEMHPSGHEVVVCTAGTVTLIQEIAGEIIRTQLAVGQYAINAPGVWHTADVPAEATMLFITSGQGTQHRPRQADVAL